jgi:Ca-activated chloride channel family protein
LSGRSVVKHVVPYTVAVCAGLVVILVASLIVRSPSPSTPRCAVALQVTSSTEKDLLIKSLAAAYNRERRPLPSGGCAQVLVDGFTSGAARDAVASNWSKDKAEGRPRPDVWLPTSSMWADELRANRGYADAVRLPRNPRSLAHSPMVIAMPEEMARAIGWPKKPLTWREVLELDSDVWIRAGHPEWGRFGYAKDNPARSTSGFAATVASYYAGTGKQHGLDPKADIGAPAVEDFVRRVEANVRFHPDDIMDFLNALGEADKQGRAQSYISVVVMQEELAYLYDKGNPQGDPATIDTSPRANTQLVAIQPDDGTLMLDHPYIELPWAGRAERDAARDFLDFLLAPAQQASFARLGFRDPQDRAPRDLADTLQFRQDQRPSLMAPPSAEAIKAIRASWKKLSKRANLLVVVDQSGSMSDRDSVIPGVAGKQARMAAAKAALLRNSTQLNPEDYVELWSFASNPSNLQARVLKKTRFGDGARFADAVQSLDVAKRPYNNTALCLTIRTAQQRMLRSLDPKRINAIVVLSDGKDAYPGGPACDMRAIAKQLVKADPTHQVKIFPIGMGTGSQTADIDGLTRVANATGAPIIDAVKEPSRLDNAFATVFEWVSPGR